MPSWNLLSGGLTLTEPESGPCHTQKDLPPIKGFHFKIHLESEEVNPVSPDFVDPTRC